MYLLFYLITSTTCLVINITCWCFLRYINSLFMVKQTKSSDRGLRSCINACVARFRIHCFNIFQVHIQEKKMAHVIMTCWQMKHLKKKNVNKNPAKMWKVTCKERDPTLAYFSIKGVVWVGNNPCPFLPLLPSLGGSWKLNSESHF